MTDPAAEKRVLVCAPTGRDGPLVCAALQRAGMLATAAATVADLCAALNHGAGALIIAEEALDELSLRALMEALEAQPPWSDLPVVILTLQEGLRGHGPARNPVLERANVTLVERPLASATLVVAVRAALRARGRQYAMRETLQQVQEQSSELRRLSEERALLLQSERTARHVAEDANRAKDDFLAVISHELRTPLSAILGWTRLLVSGRVKPDRLGHAVAVIDRNANSLAQLVEDLLDVSRIISGKLKLEESRVEPAKIIAAAVETVHLAADARGVVLGVELASPPGAAVLGDPSRLQQVVWNLLHNAIKFTPAGGKVSVRLRGEDQQVIIEVADTGRGIDPAFLPYVFEPFRQAESPTTRSTGGLGLGLAISRQIVEMHGGRIELASDGLDRGTTFTVRLPVAQRPAAPVAATSALARAAAASEPESLPGLAGARILVVDDDADTRELLRTAFELCSAEVALASSAEEALRSLESSVPTVLVSDLSMPGEDGYSLIRRVRERPPEAGGAVPAIALTALAREEDKALTLAAGYQLHVSKPVSTGELMRAVASLMKTRGASVG